MRTLPSLALAGVVVFAACDEAPTPTAASPAGPVVAANHLAGGANGRTSTLRADLGELNGSGATGRVTLRLKGSTLDITLTAQGLSAGLPHAQHIHVGGANICPRPEADFDADGDGLVDTLEGAPAYGGVRVSLTTTGDAGAASGLAVDRFPTAGRTGTVTYRRTLELPAGVTPDDIADGVVVVHGVASLFGDAAAYDGEPRSSLTDALPLEATVPALCGALSAPGAR